MPLLRRLLLIAISLPISVHAATKIEIKGEQIDFPPPQKSKLAFFSGDPKGIYVTEYTDAKDKVDSWKTYLISDSRYPHHMGSWLDLIAFALGTLQEKCPTIRFSEIEPLLSNIFPGKAVAVAYYCPEKLPNAPYGEAALNFFLEGEDYNFHHWHSWRPQEKPKEEDIFGVNHFSLLTDYIVMREYLSICNPEKGKPCRYNKLYPHKNKWQGRASDLSEDDLKRFTTQKELFHK
ncbi:hypothetical protein ACFFHT_06165 [Gallibacterium melopsittaci]|uniref:Uncharacterized protein n=2 Tax=Gallibacterium TaxID=155493 RepID=A0ABV6H290_9PAST